MTTETAIPRPIMPARTIARDIAAIGDETQGKRTRRYAMLIRRAARLGSLTDLERLELAAIIEQINLAEPDRENHLDADTVESDIENLRHLEAFEAARVAADAARDALPKVSDLDAAIRLHDERVLPQLHALHAAKRALVAQRAARLHAEEEARKARSLANHWAGESSVVFQRGAGG